MKIKLIIFILLFFTSLTICDEVVLASEMTDYDFSIPSKVFNENNDDVTFDGIIKYVTGQSEGLFEQKIIRNIFEQILGIKSFIISAVSNIVIASLLSLFANSTNNQTIGKTTFFTIYIFITSIFINDFMEIYEYSINKISIGMDFFTSLIPVYFCAYTFSNGIAASNSIYGTCIICMTLIFKIIVKALFPATKLYLILSVINNFDKEQRLNSLKNLIKKLIICSNRIIISVALGQTAVKSQISSATKGIRANLIKRIISTIPGIGNSAIAVADTITSSGKYIKNTIGLAGIVGLIIIILIPFINIYLKSIVYSVINAVLEPILDKSIVSAINSVIDSISLIIYLMCSLTLAFILIIVVLCMTSNGA